MDPSRHEDDKTGPNGVSWECCATALLIHGHQGDHHLYRYERETNSFRHGKDRTRLTSRLEVTPSSKFFRSRCLRFLPWYAYIPWYGITCTVGGGGGGGGGANGNRFVASCKVQIFCIYVQRENVSTGIEGQRNMESWNCHDRERVDNVCRTFSFVHRTTHTRYNQLNTNAQKGFSFGSACVSQASRYYKQSRVENK